ARTRQWEETNKEIESFSFSVSHDLRAPLRAIDGWSEALFEDYFGKLDEKAQKYLQRIRSETNRMGILIEDLLRLSKLTRTEMHKTNTNLSQMAKKISERLLETQKGRQIEFISGENITANVDPNLLDVALTNLIDNAFKFTGKIDNPKIEFGKYEQAGEEVFFVRDNGSGFNMIYSEKLFGPFQRMHKTSEFPGTGIGLTIVQRIIHKHGGRIWAESEIRKGTTFYFTLEERI
ncbi:MAG: GHKL domain-containing protein, partial [Leptospiraceae bacterium]|nr:GHKL domain-containing protein [Leptospiraceae bacterium]